MSVILAAPRHLEHLFGVYVRSCHDCSNASHTTTQQYSLRGAQNILKGHTTNAPGSFQAKKTATAQGAQHNKAAAVVQSYTRSYSNATDNNKLLANIKEDSLPFQTYTRSLGSVDKTDILLLCHKATSYSSAVQWYECAMCSSQEHSSHSALVQQASSICAMHVLYVGACRGMHMCVCVCI